MHACHYELRFMWFSSTPFAIVMCPTPWSQSIGILWICSLASSQPTVLHSTVSQPEPQQRHTEEIFHDAGWVSCMRVIVSAKGPPFFLSLSLGPPLLPLILIDAFPILISPSAYYSTSWSSMLHDELDQIPSAIDSPSKPALVPMPISLFLSMPF